MNLPELFYDTETSGLHRKLEWDDPLQPHVIQLGWVLSTKDRIYSEGNILIRPATNEWEMNPKAEAVHGITKNDVLRKGIRADIAAYLFLELCSNSSFRVCHNTKFDQKIMTTLCKRHKVSANYLWNNTYCTMLEATDLCKLPGKFGNYKWPTLQELHTHLFGTGFEGAHDALEDVRAMRRCYYAMKELGL